MNVKQSLPAVSHLICFFILHYRCSKIVSLNAHFPRDYIQLCLDNNLTAIHRNIVLLCSPQARDRAQQYWRWLRELKIQMREEMGWYRCAVVQREQHAYRVSTHNHTPPHTKLDTRASDSSATQSSWSRANPSTAGWLGSNHHSQQGQNERMADSLWRGPLSHSRLMGQILGRFMRHPISRRTYHKKSLMWHGTWKQAFHLTEYRVCICCQKCVFR